MKCEYNDGLKVEYSDSLRVTMGDEVDVFVEHGYIPANIRQHLNEASGNNDCGRIRRIAEAVTNTVGRHACFADFDSTACKNY